MPRLISFIFVLLIYMSNLMAQTIRSPLPYSFEEYLNARENTLLSMSWIPVGPVMNSARVESVQADPGMPGTIYVAFGSGNLWKTTNNGLTWKTIFEDKPSLGIGDIALAPSDPNIIYIGTGESLRKNRNLTMPGNGVYRSDDAGTTWTHLGLEDSWHIGEITVHPDNPDIVFVAVLGKFWTPSESKGIYRSIDGGKNWKRVLYVDENTRANDVVIAPGNPHIIYASMWENDLDSALMQSVYGPKSGIYKSEDGGDTWKRLSEGLPQGPKIGRIGLAVSYQNPEKVYALIDNRNKKRPNIAEVYKTEDGGQSWQRSHHKELNIFSVIGWYFADIYVNPKNDEEVFGLGVRLAHSTDGGKTCDLIGGKVEHLQPSMAQTLHLDHCEMWVNPLNTRHLLLGNDGGLYQTYDKGKSWLHLNNIPTGEFYTVTLDNQNPYNIYGGTQDNSTVYGPAKEWTTEKEDSWKYLWIDAWSGGDGCVTQVDPDDPNTVYWSAQEGAIRRKDMAADSSIKIAPKRLPLYEELLKCHFVTPYFISPHNSKTLYHAGNYILKSADRGSNWELISSDLTASSDPMKISHATSAIAESKRQKGLLYAGTDRGAFWCTKDEGQNWIEYSKGLPNGYIRSISPSNFKLSRVYVAMTGINYDDLDKYLFVSENFGETWKSISSNLPNEPVNVILEDPFHENILYAGCYRGVLCSMDRGNTWYLLGRDMPAASIGDLRMQERERELVAATHGRGIYFVNLDPIYELNEMEFPPTENLLLEILYARYPKIRDRSKDINRASVEKIPISFWLARDESVTLSVLDKKNKVLWKKEIEGNKGLNQFRWGLVIAREESSLPYFIHYEKYLKVGKYVVELKTSEGSLKRSLKVRKWDN